jgi:hypothetical protein
VGVDFPRLGEPIGDASAISASEIPHLRDAEESAASDERSKTEGEAARQIGGPT